MPLTLQDARRQVREREAFRARQAEAEAQTGVRWSGMEPDPHRALTDVEVEREARKLVAKSMAWANSPRRAFLRAIRELDELGYCAEAAKLEGEYLRNLADDRRPLDVASVGRCIAVLAKTNHPTAREAEMALSRLLVGTEKAAA
jgi:hypothetical protein